MNAKSKIITIKPFKNWLSVLTLLLFCTGTLFCFAVQCTLIVADRGFFILPLFVVTLLFCFFGFKQLLWLTIGRTEIEMNSSEITVRKISWIFKSSKSYPTSLIHKISSQGFYRFQWLKHFPLGKFYLEMIGFLWIDNKSVVIESYGKQKEILKMLTQQQADQVLKTISL